MSDFLNNIILILIIIEKTLILIKILKKPSADDTKRK